MSKIEILIRIIAADYKTALIPQAYKISGVWKSAAIT